MTCLCRKKGKKDCSNTLKKGKKTAEKVNWEGDLSKKEGETKTDGGWNCSPGGIAAQKG